MDMGEFDNDVIKVLRKSSVFEDPNFTLLYEYADRKYFAISYELNNQNSLSLEFFEKGESYTAKKILDFKLSNLMAYEGYPLGVQNKADLNKLGNNTLLQFVPDSSKLFVSFFETKKSPNEIQMHTRAIDFTELFNCPRKLEKESDLKGIFFFAGKSTFFIFLGRSFLEIKEDLFATR